MKAPILTAIIVATTFITGCASTPASQVSAPVAELPLHEKSLIVTIKTDQTRQAGMGLHLARSAAKKGADVTVIFGADGINYPKSAGSQTQFEATQEEPRKIVQDIMDLGGDIYVCKLCTIWLDLKSEDFLDGVEIVNSQSIFDALFADDAVTLEF